MSGYIVTKLRDLVDRRVFKNVKVCFMVGGII